MSVQRGCSLPPELLVPRRSPCPWLDGICPQNFETPKPFLRAISPPSCWTCPNDPLPLLLPAVSKHLAPWCSLRACPCVLGVYWSGFPRVWVFSKPKNKARLFGVPGMTSLLSGLLSCPHPTLTQGHQKGSLPDSLLLWCPGPRAASTTCGLPGPLGRELLGGEVAGYPGGRGGLGPSPLLQALAYVPAQGPSACRPVCGPWVLPSVQLLLQSPRPLPLASAWEQPLSSHLVPVWALSLGSARRSVLILGGNGQGIGRRAY